MVRLVYGAPSRPLWRHSNGLTATELSPPLHCSTGHPRQASTHEWLSVTTELLLFIAFLSSSAQIKATVLKNLIDLISKQGRTLFQRVEFHNVVAGPISSRLSCFWAIGRFRRFRLIFRLTKISESNKRHRIWSVHDDVIKWKQFPRYWPFVRGIHR